LAAAVFPTVVNLSRALYQGCPLYTADPGKGLATPVGTLLALIDVTHGGPSR
jgi:hypothetical protein